MNTMIKKVMMDLIKNKSKAVLMILTIFVGLLAVGTITMITTVFFPDVHRQYDAANPYQAKIKCDRIPAGVVDELYDIPGIKDAEGRNHAIIRLLLGEKSLNADLIMLDGKNLINKLRKSDGSYEIDKLKKGEIFIERACFPDVGKRPGDTIQAIIDGKDVIGLTVGDLVYDAASEPYMIEGDVYVYTLGNTFEMLMGTGHYNEVLLTVEGDTTNKQHIYDISVKAAEFLSSKGIRVNEVDVPEPGTFPSSEIMEGVMIILILLGGMSVVLGISLVSNVINSTMMQHIKQIGIMKAIGARSPQISAMYFGMIATTGLLAFLTALPISAVVGYNLSRFLAYMFNMELFSFRIPAELIIVLLISALVIPLLVAAVPVMKSTRMTVFDALNNNSKGVSYKNVGLVSLMIKKLKYISPKILVSVRNIFRNKTRVTLTTATLALSGMILITVMNIKTGFDRSMEEARSYLITDGVMILNSYEEVKVIEGLLSQLEGVEAVEGWAFYSKSRYMENGYTSRKVKLSGPKPDSKIIDWDLCREKLLEGRMIQPDDTNAIVVTNQFTDLYPHVKPGQVIKLKIEDKVHDFNVVGIMRMAGQPADPTLIVNYSYINSLLDGKDRILDIRLSMKEHSLAFQENVIRKAEELLNKNGLYVKEVIPGADLYEKFSIPAAILTALLMFLAIMGSIIGTIGQSGTITLNVLERSREFGIMRTLGGSNVSIGRVIVTEGVVIGICSWLVGLILSFPLTYAAGNLLGNLMFSEPLDFSFNFSGVFLWFALSAAASFLGSILPCLKLNKMATREVLVYE